MRVSIIRFGRLFPLLILIIFSFTWLSESVRLENYEILAEDQIAEVENSQKQNIDQVCEINTIGESCSGKILKLKNNIQQGIVLNIKTEFSLNDLELIGNDNSTTISESSSFTKSKLSLRNNQRDEIKSSANIDLHSEINYPVKEREEKKSDQENKDKDEKKEEVKEEEKEEKQEKQEKEQENKDVKKEGEMEQNSEERQKKQEKEQENKKEEKQEKKEISKIEIKDANSSIGNFTTNTTISANIGNLINTRIPVEKNTRANSEFLQIKNLQEKETNQTKNDLFFNNNTENHIKTSNLITKTTQNSTQLDNFNNTVNYTNLTTKKVISEINNPINSTDYNIFPKNITNDFKNSTLVEIDKEKQILGLDLKNIKSEDNSYKDEIEKKSIEDQIQMDSVNNTGINTKNQHKKRHHILIDDHHNIKKEDQNNILNQNFGNNNLTEKETALKNETKEISFDLENYLIMYNITSSEDGTQRYLLILNKDEIILVNTLLDDVAPYIGHNSDTDKLPLFMEATLNGVSKAVNVNNKKTTILQSNINKHFNHQRGLIGENEIVYRKKGNNFVGTISKFKIPTELFPLNKNQLIIDIDLVQNNISLYAYIKLETASTNKNEILRLSTTLAVSSLGVEDTANTVNVQVKDQNKVNVLPSTFTLKENNQSIDENKNNSSDTNTMSPKYEISKHPIQKSFWKSILKTYTNRIENNN
ncbi:uncharacterized protein ELE39_000464 [Cryptosporidium sp. chipmunk genotype I]|uniref:uncharacterized protein n=1 Tax=Cryptosporidium sp. chipmunk genotype I TaxID=1280935 RepID=UPI00351A0D14|nr:hypothetical protein ELE39_000464 [Cryptosporidium sp. chipmunk genotype I]